MYNSNAKGVKMKFENVLLDTSAIIKFGIKGLIKSSKEKPNRNYIISNIVLSELDGLKKDDEVGHIVREFFRYMVTLETKKPKDKIFTLLNDDKILKFDSNDINLHTIDRKYYRNKDINDSKIIEIAKDYKMKLMSHDNAMLVRAKSEDVDTIRLVIETPKNDQMLHFFWLSTSMFLGMVFGGFSIFSLIISAALYLLGLLVYVVFVGVDENFFKRHDARWMIGKHVASVVGGLLFFWLALSFVEKKNETLIVLKGETSTSPLFDFLVPLFAGMVFCAIIVFSGRLNKSKKYSSLSYRSANENRNSNICTDINHTGMDGNIYSSDL